MNKGAKGVAAADPIIPAGIVWEYLGATAPSGWLLADGSAVSRAQYPDLFKAIGTQHGAGNGNTTFNLPNRKGRAGVGRDGGQSEFATLGQTGGSKSTTAFHTHDMGSHQHARTAGGASAGTGDWVSPAGWQGVSAVGAGTGQSNGHSHSFETTTLGGGSGDGLQGWAAGDAHRGLQTIDSPNALMYGGAIGGCCLTNNNAVYGDHDHALEDHQHALEGHTHGAGSHTHSDSFGGSSPNTTGDSSTAQATNGNLQPYIVVNYIVKV